MAVPEFRPTGNPHRVRGNFGAIGLVAALLSLPLGCLPSSDPAQDRALASIRKLGGTFARDSRQAGQPAVAVDLACQPVADSDLETLKPFARLNALNVSATQVSDAGIPLLKWTGKLRSLYLDFCQVTDAGLAHVGALSS